MKSIDVMSTGSKSTPNGKKRKEKEDSAGSDDTANKITGDTVHMNKKGQKMTQRARTTSYNS
jgi:hypothetical protein